MEKKLAERNYRSVIPNYEQLAGHMFNQETYVKIQLWRKSRNEKLRKHFSSTVSNENGSSDNTNR